MLPWMMSKCALGSTSRLAFEAPFLVVVWLALFRNRMQSADSPGCFSDQLPNFHCSVAVVILQAKLQVADHGDFLVKKLRMLLSDPAAQCIGVGRPIRLRFPPLV